MRNQPITAIMQAANASEQEAIAIIESLEKSGFAVYKKKVLKNQRRPKASQPITDEMVADIIEYYFNNPTATQQDIANLFKVNIGRVNEALSERPRS